MHAPIADVLLVLFNTPTDDGWGIPAYFEGPPGAAKTKMVRAAAHAAGMRLQVLSPALMGDGAFGAVPVPVQTPKGTRLTYPAPAWADNFLDSANGEALAGVVFIDELTSAPPAMQGALLGLVQERRIGFEYLGARVRVIAAGNPPEIAANGHALNAPQANRMAHFKWSPPETRAWSDYMVGRSAPVPGSDRARETAVADDSAAVAIEERVLAGWAPAYAATIGPVAAFLNARGMKALHDTPKAEDERASGAWPSHRTWDLAVAAMTTARVLGLPIAGDDVLAALVGEGIASEFCSFRRAADLPAPDALLDGKVSFTHERYRSDRTFAVMESCVALLSPVPKSSAEIARREARAVTFWKLAGEIARGGEPDLVMGAAGALSKPEVGLGYSSTPAVKQACLAAMGPLSAMNKAKVA